REAFKVYEEVLGIDFVETTDASADFRFSDNKSGAYAGSSYGVVGGMGYISYTNINIQSSWYGSSSALDGYTFQTALHEIGHAMGLGHQGNYNGSANYANDARFANDSWQGSMMSYFSQTSNTAVDASYAFLLSPMAVDWIALDHLYSEYGFSSDNAFAGDTVYGFNTNISASVSASWADLSTYADNTAFTIVDGSGTDTVDFSGYSQDQRIDLTVTEGSMIQATISDVGGMTGNMQLAEGVVIENAITGAGDDVIIGNDASNTLDGGAGDDTLTGGEGDDHLIGGLGTDAAVFNGDYADFSFTAGLNFFDVLGEGLDRVFDSIENLIFDDQTVAYDDLVGSGPAPTTASDPDPDAQNDAISLAEGAVGVFDLFGDNGSGADAHSEGLSFDVIAVNGAAPGTFALASGADVTILANGSMTFDTNGAYDSLAVGQTETETVTYTIEATDGGTDTATVTITVSGTNDGPVALADGFTVAEDVTLNGNLLADNGSGADSDVDASDTVEITHVNGQAINAAITLASGAILTVSADGTFSYNQNDAFEALDDGQTAMETFTYTISDGNGGTDTASVSIRIDGADVILTQIGTIGRDELIGTSYGDTLSGGDDRDMLDGGADDDILMGDAGRDKLYGGDGDDDLSGGTDSDRMYGGADNDELRGEEGADRMYGDGGDDNLIGGAGRDALDGGYGSDTLDGGADNDNLKGGYGDDELYGGAGDDRMRAGAGDDFMEDTEGNNTFSGEGGNDEMRGGNGDDRMRGGDGNDQLVAGDGDNRLSGDRGMDELYSGSGNDRLSGGSEDDLLDAGAGDDNLRGGTGNDSLFGGDGADKITGGSGDDLVSGGTGDDEMRGGAGADTFVFDSLNFGNDVIRDFRAGDLLDFSSLGLDVDDFTITANGRDAVLTLNSDADQSVTLQRVNIDTVDHLDFV
ncbi:MAG: M10 family metallopeptidase C-terminal domain-containing protein, partial [Pseudomonadota bacterium]